MRGKSVARNIANTHGRGHERAPLELLEVALDNSSVELSYFGAEPRFIGGVPTDLLDRDMARL